MRKLVSCIRWRKPSAGHAVSESRLESAIVPRNKENQSERWLCAVPRRDNPEAINPYASSGSITRFTTTYDRIRQSSNPKKSLYFWSRVLLLPYIFCHITLNHKINLHRLKFIISTNNKCTNKKSTQWQALDHRYGRLCLDIGRSVVRWYSASSCYSRYARRRTPSNKSTATAEKNHGRRLHP